jgi:hypothetical protein
VESGAFEDDSCRLDNPFEASCGTAVTVLERLLGDALFNLKAFLAAFTFVDVVWHITSFFHSAYYHYTQFV